MRIDMYIVQIMGLEFEKVDEFLAYNSRVFLQPKRDTAVVS